MALDAGNVKVAVTGAVYVAPTGTAGPADTTTPLAAAWKNVGYISEDGVTEGNNTETDEITAWQNSDVVRKTITKSETTYQFTMIETNSNSLSLFYGKTISASDTSHTIGGTGAGKVSLVIDVVDGAQTIRRFIPEAEVSERGEVKFAANEALGYDVTVTAYPNASIGGSVEVHYAQALD
jgi:hypothetical protein